MQHRCKRADGSYKEEKKIKRARRREMAEMRKRKGKKKRIVRIEGNNPHEFCSTSRQRG